MVFHQSFECSKINAELHFLFVLQAPLNSYALELRVRVKRQLVGSIEKKNKSV